MADIAHIKDVCQLLNTRAYEEKIPNLKAIEKKDDDDSDEDLPTQPEVSISKADLLALSNFVLVWTDALDIETVNEQFNNSDYDDIELFKQDNVLYNFGFFYVKINTACSPSEFLGLLSLVPFEHFQVPGTKQVSYATLTNLLGKESEQTVMKLMALGDHFKFWHLINPFAFMRKTNENIRMLLSGLGSLSIMITPGYLGTCMELVRNVISLGEQQSKLFKKE